MRAALDAEGLRASIERGDEDWESGVVAALHKLVRITERTATDRASP